MIDPRIVRLGIQVGDSITYYEGLSIAAKGTKFTSPNQGEAMITISNLKKETREYILRVANPFNKSDERKSVILEVGRESYGTTVLYTGDIFRAQQTPKPDVGIEIRCLTGQFNKNRLVSNSAEEISSLSDIATMVAENNEVGLSFEVQDKNISNYSFTGSPDAQIKALALLADADTYVDNGILYLKPLQTPKTGSTNKVLNKRTGMIGDAIGTENGVKVTMLYDPVPQLGGTIELESENNPVLDGSYTIYKLDFDITSREVPFYLHAEANRTP